MRRMFRFALPAMVMVSAPAFASSPSKAPPTAPAEVTAAAPAGTTLLSFVSSGDNRMPTQQPCSRPRRTKTTSVLINHSKDNKFSFVHGSATVDAM
jgi:hypothetical protein